MRPGVKKLLGTRRRAEDRLTLVRARLDGRLVRVAVGVLVAAAVLAPPTTAAAGPQTISTVAGTGVPGDSGDSGPATSAQVNQPAGVAVDIAGNFYIADFAAHRVRKVDTSGTITTVAGTGIAGFSGDGAAATAARIASPADVLVDAAGNLYIADYDNHRVRKVDTAGTITTFAGKNASGNSGDGGLATAARMANPVGLAADAAGNVYIADYTNANVRKVNTAGIISTVAGTGTEGYTGDGGPATAATLKNPGDIAVSASGDLLIADSGNSVVRKVNTVGTISTVAGTGVPGYSGDAGSATAAQLSFPVGIAADLSGGYFIADFSNHVIRKVDALGVITTVAGTGIAGYSGDGGDAIAAQLTWPARVNLNLAGDFFISDLGNGTVRKVLALGTQATAPDAPTGVSAVPGNAAAVVSWTAPADDGGTPITGYTVTSSGGQTASAGAGATSATVSGLTNGTAYTFTVTATNAVGTSVASAPSAPVTPRTVPDAPTGVSASAGNASATVTWIAPFDGGSALTGYTVTSSGGQTVTVGAGATSAAVSGLTNGTSYTFTP